MYAQFDSTAIQPTPVTGWYDAQTPAMLAVPVANILTLSQAEWDNRENTPYVQNGILVVPPTPTAAQLLATARAAQIALLTESYAAAIQAPVPYMTTTFQADFASQDILVKSLAAGAVPSGFAWYDVNNAPVPMTFVQAQGLVGVMLAQGQVAYVHLQNQKTAVLAATTISKIQAIK